MEHVPQERSLDPRREAVHVGVGDSEGGVATGIDPDQGSRSSAPPRPRPHWPFLNPRLRSHRFRPPLRALRLHSSPPSNPLSAAAPGPRLAQRPLGSPRLARSHRRRPWAPGRTGGMGVHRPRPGRLVPLLALLSWAASLGVTEETLSRIPAGEVLSPASASTGRSGGNWASFLSSFHASSLRDPNKGSQCFAMNWDIASSARGGSSPACLCLQTELGWTHCAPTHFSICSTLGHRVRLP